jgi:hypothetical protein
MMFERGVTHCYEYVLLERKYNKTVLQTKWLSDIYMENI